MPELPGTSSGLVSGEWLTLAGAIGLVVASFIKSFISGWGETKKAKEAAAFESPPSQWPSPQSVFNFIEMGQTLEALVERSNEIVGLMKDERRHHESMLNAAEGTRRSADRVADEIDSVAKRAKDTLSEIEALRSMVTQIRDVAVKK